jgi:Tfp pilus assembly protein PilV
MEPTGERGTSLLEVMVSLILLALGLLGVAPLFVLSIRDNATGSDFGQTAALGRERMETLRAEDYTSLTAGGSLTSDVTGYSDTSNPGVVVRWQIEDDVVTVDTKTISVRVVVQNSGQGPAPDLVLTTLRGSP